MSKQQPDGPVLLSGRYFTSQQLHELQETVRLFPGLSRIELAKTICENSGWVTPAGQYKTSSCQQLLEKLEGLGLITLPEKQKPRDTRERISIGPRTEPGLPIEGQVTDLGPIELEPLRSRNELRLWNEYVHRYHLLGYKRPFGAHQRYFIVSGSGQKLGCLLFVAAAWALAPRDQWIGWTETDRSLRLNLIVNNTRFLLFPWVRVKNLASKADTS